MTASVPECGGAPSGSTAAVTLRQEGEDDDQHEARERSQHIGEGHSGSRPVFLAHASMSGHDQTSAWRSRATGEGKSGYRFRQE